MNNCFETIWSNIFSASMGPRRRWCIWDSTRYFCFIQHAAICQIQSPKTVRFTGKFIAFLFRRPSVKVISDIRNLISGCCFTIGQALASTLDEEELSDLKDQFSAIDVDKNGVISLEEMRQVLLIFHVGACFCPYNSHWLSANIWGTDILCHFDAKQCIMHIYLIICFSGLSYSFLMQALAKDLPWKMKESRVLEILQAVNLFI